MTTQNKTSACCNAEIRIDNIVHRCGKNGMSPYEIMVCTQCDNQCEEAGLDYSKDNIADALGRPELKAILKIK
jgi:hypothetical protein